MSADGIACAHDGVRLGAGQLARDQRPCLQRSRLDTTDYMLAMTAAPGSGMSWQPLSNGRLASGIPNIPQYLLRGIKVGMGVDGQAIWPIHLRICRRPLLVAGKIRESLHHDTS
jgi:hypothetical protein